MKFHRQLCICSVKSKHSMIRSRIASPSVWRADVSVDLGVQACAAAGSPLGFGRSHVGVNSLASVPGRG